MTCCLIDSQLVFVFGVLRCCSSKPEPGKDWRFAAQFGTISSTQQVRIGEAGGFRLVSESYSKVFQTHLWTVDLSRSFWDRDSSNDELIVLWDPRAFWCFGITWNHQKFASPNHQPKAPLHHGRWRATTVPSTAPAPLPSSRGCDVPHSGWGPPGPPGPGTVAVHHRSGYSREAWLRKFARCGYPTWGNMGNLPWISMNGDEYEIMWAYICIYEQNIFIL